MASRRRGRGFTIIEMMVGIAVLGVLVAVAIPSFRTLILDNRRTAVVNEILSNILLARSEAVKRGQPVSICATTSGGGTSCTGGSNWSNGWMVFLDPDGNGAIASTGDVLRNFVNESSTELRITSATPGTGHFTLRPFNQAGTSGNITLCDSRGAAHARRICIQGNGRARVTNLACDGSAITCP